MAAGDFHQVNTFHDFQGQTNNVYSWYFLMGSDPTSGTVDAKMIDFFEDDLLPTLAIGLDENFTFTCIESKRIIDVDVKDKVTGIGEQKAVTIAGTIMAAEGLPASCQMVIQTLSSLTDADPTGRGRDFYYGFVEGDQADGIWLDATQNRVTGQLDAEFSSGSIVKDGMTAQWVNWSNKRMALRSAGGGPPFLNPSTDINFLRPLNHVRTQRRRQSLNPCDKYGTVVDFTD